MRWLHTVHSGHLCRFTPFCVGGGVISETKCALGLRLSPALFIPDIGRWLQPPKPLCQRGTHAREKRPHGPLTQSVGPEGSVPSLKEDNGGRGHIHMALVPRPLGSPPTPASLCPFARAVHIRASSFDQLARTAFWGQGITLLFTLHLAAGDTPFRKAPWRWGRWGPLCTLTCLDTSVFPIPLPSERVTFDL